MARTVKITKTEAKPVPTVTRTADLSASQFVTAVRSVLPASRSLLKFNGHVHLVSGKGRVMVEATGPAVLMRCTLPAATRGTMSVSVPVRFLNPVLTMLTTDWNPPASKNAILAGADPLILKQGEGGWLWSCGPNSGRLPGADLLWPDTDRILAGIVEKPCSPTALDPALLETVTKAAKVFRTKHPLALRIRTGKAELEHTTFKIQSCEGHPGMEWTCIMMPVRI